MKTKPDTDIKVKQSDPLSKFLDEIELFMVNNGLSSDQFDNLLITKINFQLCDIQEIWISLEDFNNYMDAKDSDEAPNFLDFVKQIREMTIFCEQESRLALKTDFSDHLQDRNLKASMLMRRKYDTFIQKIKS